MEVFGDLVAVDDVPEGGMVQVEVDGHALLVAKVLGAFYVADAYCPHLHGHLWKGTLEGTVVTCPRHHSQFDLADGSVVRWTDWTGAVKSVAQAMRHPRPLRVYESGTEGGWVKLGAQKLPIIPESELEAGAPSDTDDDR